MRNICKDKSELDRLLFKYTKNVYDSGDLDEGEMPKELIGCSNYDSIPANIRDNIAELDGMQLVRIAMLCVLGQYHQRTLSTRGRTIYTREGINLHSAGLGDEFDSSSSHGGIEGFHQLPTGEVFYAFESNLDCECPADIIIYAENGFLKLYAPEKGNCYDARYMCLFGAQQDRMYDSDVNERCDDSDSDSDDDNDDNDDNELQNWVNDKNLEIADIEDYFHNRKEGEHADGLKDYNPQYSDHTLEWNLAHPNVSLPKVRKERNICKDRAEFLETLFTATQNISEIEDDFITERGPFKDKSLDEWERILNRTNEIQGILLSDHNTSRYWANLDEDTDAADVGGSETPNGLSGFHQLPTGEWFLAFDIQKFGDVPSPNGIIYVENGDIKVYYPEKGNIFNKKYLCTYGYERDALRNAGLDENLFDESEIFTPETEANPDEELADIEDFFHNRNETFFENTMKERFASGNAGNGGSSNQATVPTSVQAPQTATAIPNAPIVATEVSTDDLFPIIGDDDEEEDKTQQPAVQTNAQPQVQTAAPAAIPPVIATIIPKQKTAQVTQILSAAGIQIPASAPAPDPASAPTTAPTTASPQAPAAEEEEKLEHNEFYCVTSSAWALRKAISEEKGTVATQGISSYRNVFSTYNDALDYVHTLMMLNHNSPILDWEQFSKSIEITENSPKSVIGYKHHKMKNGVERFEGYDMRGLFPCVIDDITITKRVFNVVQREYDKKDLEMVYLKPLELEPYFTLHRVKDERVTEFTSKQQEEHQKLIDEFAKNMNKKNAFFSNEGADKEANEMLDILAQLNPDEEDEGKNE